MKKRIWILAAAVLLAAAAFAGGCGRKETAQATQAETVQEETTQEETLQPETENQTEEAAEPVSMDSYHMLQGTVVKASQDGTVFTLQADDGQSYDIALADIRDVETEIQPDVHIAIAYIGDRDFDQESTQLILALPEQEEWTICQETGTTTANAMSSFTLETDQGVELQLLKDNCPIEEGALSQDSGDRVTVIYVTAMEMNFPIEVLKAQ